MSAAVKAPSSWQLEQAMSCFQAMQRSADPETDMAALEIASDDVYAMLYRVIRAANEAEAFADANETRITDLKDRKTRYEERARHLRATAFAVMDVLGETKITQPDFTVSIRAGSQRPVITDEALIPAEYKRTVVTVDKTSINQAVKDGLVIPGVELSNALPSLSIRTK